MESSEGSYSAMFSALNHDVRRRILLLLAERDMSFTELYETIGVSSSHLNYHLVVLDGLVTKRGASYRLSTTGSAAVAMFKKPESPAFERPPLSILYKYVAVALLLLFTTLMNFLLTQYEISFEVIKGSLYDTLTFMIFATFPAFFMCFAREYWLLPIDVNPRRISSHY